MTAPGLPFVKGHGTENDFVVVPDVEGRHDLADDAVQRLCDRRAGLGADGVLRVVPTALVPEAAAWADDARWFMDHRNADGSRPEMCGNGIRVYARYLVHAGLESAGPVRIATRGGVKVVDVEPDGSVSVDMGHAVVGDPLLVDGVPATTVDMGNPHAVLAVPSVEALGVLDPDRKDVNVEYVEDAGPQHLVMRVHERGVGETRSCGTGACAAVVAHSLWHDTPRGTPHDVDVPGGRLEIRWQEDGSVRMTGPAVLLAEGTVSTDWLEGR